MRSIVSYPDRGSDGKNTYRGNCSGLLIEDLIKQFKVKQISDFMVGSGTTEDVAYRMGIQSNCFDLNRGFDLLNCEIPLRSDFIFWHPPYWNIIKYAGEQYSAELVEKAYGFDPRATDLSREQPWEEFVKQMNYCMVKQFSTLEKGGRMATLVGDIKKKGKLYSMILELAKPGTIENIVIKAQHNCWSDRQNYSNNNFIPIEHEYLLIIRKDDLMVFPVQMTRNATADMRDIKTSTWRDVVAAVMDRLGGKASLADIYKAVEGHKKTKDNPHWKEKIRQILQKEDCFSSQERGVWNYAPAA
ncbi:site-specific DNA-methyltransferase [Anaerotruncus colihominis]|uniref:Site-specific DNA-methyltransferase n=1 Tax=Anaerotruncus colihominis TaxID=169435 RepID=A0A845SUY0_9FIRM|nr:site-specific DNA-methyltransferase [Anaerotruncus colihominis]NDO37757.1 site-specific DNA-methyltransferase [Anaerotruncus colihominis]